MTSTSVKDEHLHHTENFKTVFDKWCAFEKHPMNVSNSTKMTQMMIYRHFHTDKYDSLVSMLESRGLEAIESDQSKHICHVNAQ